MAGRQFSERDLRRWAEQGLITRDQLRVILASEGVSPTPANEAREGLNLPTIGYYLGASLALLAITVFASINWSDASEGARLSLVAGSMAGIAGAGYLVWRRTAYRRGGSALITIACAMTPLLMFAVAALFSNRESESLFDEDSLDEGTLLQAASLCVMVIVLAVSRVGMVALAVSGQTIGLAATASAWALRDQNDDVFSEVHLVLSIATAGILLVGLALSAIRGREEEAFWFELSGSVAFFYAFTAFVMSEWHLLAPALYIVVGVIFLGASSPLRRLSLLLVGVGFIYAFVLRLLFDTFEGSPVLPLAIAAVGLSMIALAMAYQRQRRQPA